MTDDPTPMPQPKLGWHGFHSFVAFMRATLALGGTLTFGLWVILTWALDGRYASASIASEVQTNGSIAREVKEEVRALQGQIISLNAQLLRDRLLSLRVSQCDSESPGQRQFYAQEIAETTAKYISLTGNEPPPLPLCNDLR